LFTLNHRDQRTVIKPTCRPCYFEPCLLDSIVLLHYVGPCSAREGTEYESIGGGEDSTVLIHYVGSCSAREGTEYGSSGGTQNRDLTEV
jgi:hypothetical protein